MILVVVVVAQAEVIALERVKLIMQQDVELHSGSFDSLV